MESLGLFNQAPYANVRSIGMPRALLHHRYGTLWTAFFKAIGVHPVLSPPTDKDVIARGDALSNDECCLASKIYLGHVASLIGTCDAVFVPSVANVGLHRGFCTKFQALPDLVANTFADERLPIVSCLVNETEERKGMKAALLDMAAGFGIRPSEAKQAWKEAARAQEHEERIASVTQARKLATLEALRSSESDASEAPVGILLAAHPYLTHDPFMGGAIVDMLEHMNALVLLTDETDRKRALQASLDFSDTLPWIVNREIIGSIMLLHDQVDGIVLVSAFPCGPDSMTDDAIVRCMQGKPILNLTVDAQSGTAGLETRIESFVDILRYQKQGGYVHG